MHASPQSLLLEMETSKQKIDMCATHFHKDMQDLKSSVGGRNSVSKEVCMHIHPYVCLYAYARMQIY